MTKEWCLAGGVSDQRGITRGHQQGGCHQGGVPCAVNAVNAPYSVNSEYYVNSVNAVNAVKMTKK